MDAVNRLSAGIDPEEIWSCDIDLVVEIEPGLSAFFVAIEDLVAHADLWRERGKWSAGASSHLGGRNTSPPR
jgi:hypothetical protein